jgi:hypothetical protein
VLGRDAELKGCGEPASTTLPQISGEFWRPDCNALLRADGPLDTPEPLGKNTLTSGTLTGDGDLEAQGVKKLGGGIAASEDAAAGK